MLFCLRLVFSFALRFFVCIVPFLFVFCTFLFALCFFVCIVLFCLCCASFVCVLYFCLGCAFFVCVVYFFNCVVLFCVRFLFLLGNVFFLVCVFLISLMMCSFLFAFSFFACVGPCGPPYLCPHRFKWSDVSTNFNDIVPYTQKFLSVKYFLKYYCKDSCISRTRV